MESWLKLITFTQSVYYSISIASSYIELYFNAIENYYSVEHYILKCGICTPIHTYGYRAFIISHIGPIDRLEVIKYRYIWYLWLINSPMFFHRLEVTQRFEHLLYIPKLRVFVAYCPDMWLHLYTDITVGFKLICKTKAPRPLLW